MISHKLLRACAALCALAVLTVAPAVAAAEPAPAVAVSPRISVEVVGAGPDVVLIPGLGSSREVWRPLVERLSRTHRLHLVQLSGFAGQPAAAGEGPVLVPAVEAIAAYVRAAGLERPAVIGHSLGGAAGLMLAAREPQLVGRVMVVDALPFYSALYGPGATAEGARPFADQAYAQVTGADPAAFETLQRGAAAMLVKDPAARERVLAWSLASDRRAIAEAMREVMTTDLRPELGTVSAPVTVLYAWDEAMGRPAEAVDGLYRREYAGLPGARLVRVDGAFHFLMADQPQRFAEEVERFLR